MKKMILLVVLLASQYAHAQVPVLVKDIIQNAGSSGNSYPYTFFGYNDKLMFCANYSSNSKGLYLSDGTDAGTYLIRDITNGGCAYLVSPAICKGKVVYRGRDANGEEPWITDGTNAGTSIISNINTIGGGNSYPAGFTTYKNKVYFSADDGVYGRELWVTDCNAAGTQMVKDIFTGLAGSACNEFVILNDKLYFVATDSAHGDAIWTTDGTEAGTQMVIDINTLSNGLGSSQPTWLTVYNNKLYFAVNDGVHGREIWVCDGTASGTQMIKDINPGSLSSNPTGLVVCNDKLYFMANTTAAGEEIWVTDGTDAGTQMIIDINPGSGSGVYDRLYNYNNKLYFTGNDGNDLEPWVSDGTVAGTMILKRIYQYAPSHMGSNPNGFTLYNGKVYFVATDATNGCQLWATDGTPDSTKMVTLGAAPAKDALANTSDLSMLATRGSLYFSAAYDPSIGCELYKLTTPFPASVHDLRQLTDIAVYPNPAKESITIQYTLTTAGSPQYRLYNITGKCVGTWQDETRSAGKQSKQINISNLAPAVYQLLIEMNGKMQTVSVIKR